MKRHGFKPWLLVSVVVLVFGLGGLVAGCGGTNATTTATATRTPLEIRVSPNVRYMTEREGDNRPLLDVCAPEQVGPWPLVVMLHGGSLNKESLRDWAYMAAGRGAVVLVPDWPRFHGTMEEGFTLAQLRAALVGQIGDVAAAVRFARGTAARYGGDPGHLTLFGHSYGAMAAAMEAFSAAPASEGGLKGAGSTIPESLVVFDGDYLLAQQDPWDAELKEDPGIMQVYTPWQHLGRRVDFPITVIGAGDPSLSRRLGDPWAKDSWFVVRDPSGEIRRGLQELGAFDKDVYHTRYLNEDLLELFAQRLRADGDTVNYVRLTDSSHVLLASIFHECSLVLLRRPLLAPSHADARLQASPRTWPRPGSAGAGPRHRVRPV